LDPCVWYECINPPLPPDLGLKYDYNGNPVPFGSNVTYSCAKSNLFFEQDRSMKSFPIECMTDGSFDDPPTIDDWPKCVDSKYIIYELKM